jgi:hypothetical protein
MSQAIVPFNTSRVKNIIEHIQDWFILPRSRVDYHMDFWVR